MRRLTDVSNAQAARQVGATDLAAAPWGRPLISELLESLPDPVIGCDAGGHIVYWSKAAREAYGFSIEEAAGERLLTLLQTRLPKPLLEIIEEVTDIGRWQGRLVHRAKDGREVTVESRWVSRYDDAGKLVGGFRIEREYAGAQGPGSEPAVSPNPAPTAERLEGLGQPAGGVVHEFNNALAIIINYAALVSAEVQRLRSVPTDAERAALGQDIAEISTAAQRAAELTHQLLAFSRQEVGAPQPLNLNSSVREMQPLLTRTVGEHIRCKLALFHGLARVRADPAEIQQVLVNLAVNARDAMPTGGALMIDTGNVELDAGAATDATGLSPGRYVRLRISDTGAGMTPDVLERAFDPFFTTKSADSGSGLGLSSVYGIITRAGGHARLHSEPGMGTSFVALLPALENREPTDTDASPNGRVPAGEATILLAEDEPALAEIARRILASVGYEVLVAGNDAQALELAAAHDATIDLLLTDMVMPGLPGHQLADRVRALRPDVTVVYMSGFSESVLGAATQTQPATLIDKPFTAAVLLEHVRHALAARSGSPR